MQRRRIRLGAGIARNHVQLRHRHEKLGLVGVVQFEEFLLAGAEVHAHQALVAADAVALMHHRVADLELGQVLQPVVETGLARGFAPGTAWRAGVQLGFGNEGELLSTRGQRKTGVQRGHAQRQWRTAGDKAGEIGAGLSFDAVFAQHGGQGFAPAGRFGQQQHAALEARQVVLQLVKRVFGPAVDGDVGQGGGCGVSFVLQHQPAVALGGGEEGFVGEEEFVRRQQRTRLVALQQLVARACFLPEGGNRPRCVAMSDEDGILRQVVENGGRFLEEERNVVLDAGAGDALRHILVNARLGRVALEGLAELLAEARAALVVHREFARRQQAHFRHRVDGALGIDVEGLDALDLVVEQIEPVRHGRTHREEVDQAAANRVFAGRHHLRDVRVAGQRDLAAEFLGVDGLALLEGEGVGRHELRRGQPIDGGRGRHQQDVQLALHGRPQRGQTLGNQVLVRREAVVGQRFPIRQQADAQLRAEPRDFVEQALGIVGIGCDDGEQLAGMAAGDFSQRQGIRGTRQGRQIDARTSFGQGGERKQGGRDGHCEAKSVTGLGL